MLFYFKSPRKLVMKAEQKTVSVVRHLSYFSAYDSNLYWG